MSFLVYLFVLLVAACSVVFGLDWMQAPLQPPSHAQRTVQAGSANSAAVKSAVAAAKPATEGVRPVSDTTGTIAASANGAEASASADATRPKATPMCDIAACEQAYRSFTPADCTYQPFGGARRLCTRGNSARRRGATLAVAEAHAQARCNVSACASAYDSFDAATCTYQPYGGPRRLCTK